MCSDPANQNSVLNNRKMFACILTPELKAELELQYINIRLNVEKKLPSTPKKQLLNVRNEG
jgi:hypothetical protein